MKSIIAIAALCGCTGYKVGNAVEPRISDRYEPERLDEWRDRVEVASRAWRDSLRGCMDPFPLAGDEPALPITLYTPEEWTRPGAIGFAPADYVEVKGPLGDEPMGFMVDVLAHELGHVMGLEHNTDPTSVMGPNAIAVPNTRDIERARALLGCE